MAALDWLASSLLISDGLAGLAEFLIAAGGWVLPYDWWFPHVLHATRSIGLAILAWFMKSWLLCGNFRLASSASMKSSVFFSVMMIIPRL